MYANQPAIQLTSYTKIEQAKTIQQAFDAAFGPNAWAEQCVWDRISAIHPAAGDPNAIDAGTWETDCHCGAVSVGYILGVFRGSLHQAIMSSAHNSPTADELTHHAQSVFTHIMVVCLG